MSAETTTTAPLAACIIAGIINTRTGEISETVTSVGSKTALRLKVRDELNQAHGDNAFMVFEFKSWDTRIDHIERNMHKDAPANALNTLEILRARYLVVNTQTSLQQEEIKLSQAREVVAKINEFMQGADSFQQEFARNALMEKLDEVERAVSDIKTRLQLRQDHLRRLESNQTAQA